MRCDAGGGVAGLRDETRTPHRIETAVHGYRQQAMKITGRAGTGPVLHIGTGAAIATGPGLIGHRRAFGKQGHGPGDALRHRLHMGRTAAIARNRRHDQCPKAIAGTLWKTTAYCPISANA